MMAAIPASAPAILATMIYSMPPIIRLTNTGIRQVSAETIESATSFGSSKLQLLFKIKIPLSLPSIMMGINQVIMMALALVVLACFIGAEGIGGQVWQAIRRLDVGWAMEGGLCILFMAIMFDRFSMSFSKTKQILPSNVQKFYLLPQSWEKFTIARIIEKPLKTQSNYIVSGLYFYTNDVIKIARGLTKSSRGELEITDINNYYLHNQKLELFKLESDFSWLDTGTYSSLIKAVKYFQDIENNTGEKVACIEEIALKLGFINKSKFISRGVCKTTTI